MKKKRVIKRYKKLPPHTYEPHPIAKAGEISKPLIIAIVAIIALAGLTLFLFFGQEFFAGQAIFIDAPTEIGQAGIFAKGEATVNDTFTTPVSANIYGSSIAVSFKLTYDNAIANCDNIFALLDARFNNLAVLRQASCEDGVIEFAYAGLCAPNNCPNALSGTVNFTEIDFTPIAEGELNIQFTEFNIINRITQINSIPNIQNTLLTVGPTPPCEAGLTYCDGACVDRFENPENCGACGVTCEDSQNCDAGFCVDVACQNHSDCPENLICKEVDNVSICQNPPAVTRDPDPTPSSGGGGGTGGGGGRRCLANWTCSSWSYCNATLNQTRTCVDQKNCLNDKVEVRSCARCVESWECGLWSVCQNSRQTRTCADQHYCGTTLTKPMLSRSCTEGEQPRGYPQQTTQRQQPPLTEPGQPESPKSFLREIWDDHKVYVIAVPLALILILVVVLLILHFVEKKHVVYNHDELKEWVRKEREMGTSNVDIKEILAGHTGWTEEEVEQAFESLRDTEEPTEGSTQ